MKRNVLAAMILLVFFPFAGHGRESGLTIPIPAARKTVPPKGKTIFLRVVTDDRRFEDRPGTANIPSLAATLARTTSERKSLAVARARDGYGKARHNIFMGTSQPVESVIRDVVCNALTAKGFTVVTQAAQTGRKALVVDVSIEQFWGYILVAGGGWGGGGMSMNGEMSTVLTIVDGGRVFKLPVTAKASHRFMLMTKGHWAQMFNEMLVDYLNNFDKISF